MYVCMYMQKCTYTYVHTYQGLGFLDFSVDVFDVRFKDSCHRVCALVCTRCENLLQKPRSHSAILTLTCACVCLAVCLCVCSCVCVHMCVFMCM